MVNRFPSSFFVNKYSSESEYLSRDLCPIVFKNVLKQLIEALYRISESQVGKNAGGHFDDFHMVREYNT